MNNSCEGFWFWFIRTFAELLVGIALVFSVCCILVIFALVMYFSQRKNNDK